MQINLFKRFTIPDNTSYKRTSLKTTLLKGLLLMTVFTSKELWINQAPSFNFELDEAELLAKALEAGFVTEIGDDQYEMNEDY
tara:strand:+ start:316 stop:564 length:249 start_codon:yes stop_codon:yes gene_type:complete